MISFQDALRTILSSSSPLGKEKVSLMKASGRVLFRDLIAREDFPPFGSSSMDGFAVRWTDVSGASPSSPANLKVVGEARAGHLYKKRLAAGETIRVMTGGCVPAGADTVVPLEQTEPIGEKRVRVVGVEGKGEHIRSAGRDVRLGEVVVRAGTTIVPAHLGLLASLGHSRISLHKRPIVKILPTGDELVPVDRVPKRGKIRSGSPHVLAGYVKEAGGRPEVCGILPDSRKELRKGIRAALPADILLTIGGVSTGKYDLVRYALKDIGARTVFWQVNIKPGRPLVFAMLDSTFVLGLPGNPASTLVGFLQFVRPLIWRMSGQVERKPRIAKAFLEHSLEKEDDRRHFLRGRAREKSGKIQVATAGSQSSSSMRSLLAANCLIVFPEETTHLAKGEEVQIEWL